MAASARNSRAVTDLNIKTAAPSGPADGGDGSRRALATLTNSTSVLPRWLQLYTRSVSADFLDSFKLAASTHFRRRDAQILKSH
jgi:hypothetical protein